MFDPSATLNVKVGQRVKGGETVLAVAPAVTAPASRSTKEQVRA
jgi:hypothetical protein